MILRYVLLMLIFSGFRLASAESAEYAVANIPAPVLNTPDFASVFGGPGGRKLKTDSCGQVRELEYIALPGTVFTIIKKHRSVTTDIYQVATNEYAAPPHVKLYVDGRFLTLHQVPPKPRTPLLPAQHEIISTLKAVVGSSYVWGGNRPAGVPELAAWYYRDVRSNDVRSLTLSGLDCSGMIYYATGGWTPRNTSQLITYGRGIAIAGKQPEEIAALLRPLDLIAWNGHVIVVLDRQTAIESRLACGDADKGGVVVTPLIRRISEIMRSRQPVNAWPGEMKRQGIFVARRWYPGNGD